MVATGKAAKPHMLGGSNNLVSERNRREKAEAKLQSTRQNLRTVAQDLTPQLQQLAQAVECRPLQSLQMGKRQRLKLDEASQELLEGLQDQINDVEARQQQCCIVDCRIENSVKQVERGEEQATAERYELRTLMSKLQEVQDEHAVEMQLLHQELVASKEFMTQRVNAVEDAVASVRSEIARGKEQHHMTSQNHVSKIDELDDKLFALDKELLKLKLALPPTVKAQIPAFTDQCSASGAVTRVDLVQGGDLSTTLKLQEVAADLEVMKTDSLAYRSADRKQFDALTNRMREAAKSHHALKKDLDGRLQDMRVCCDQMTTKVPSELSKRLQKAQTAWDNELKTLKASVLNLEAYYNVQKRKEFAASSEQQNLSDGVRNLHKELNSLREEHGSHLTRVDADLLGLYDWTREKIALILPHRRHE